MDIPAYSTSKKSSEKNLKKFLEYVEDVTFLNETEDPKKGQEYIKEAIKKADINEVLKNIDNFGTDKLIALVTIAEEEDLTAKEIFDLLMNSLNIEPASGKGGENYVLIAPVKREMEVKLNGFAGKLDNKRYNDIYTELKNKLTPEQVAGIEENFHSLIENGIMEVQIPQYYWAAFVDEEKFKDHLVSKLDVTEEEIEKLARVG